ncbi:MAG: DUF2520 domain-containing protein [Chitinophagaceae bacterium]|nr:DUF2520 domain-containing protein [Chitinophagaceae bacterium]
MRVVLIGSGNVATVLGRLIHKAGHEILQVVSRDARHAARLANEWSASYTDLQGKINDTADLYIIAVKDEAIEGLKKKLHLGSRPVVHTAGAVSIEALKGISANYGVLYPLQSLRAEMEPGMPIPLLVDGNSIETITLLEDFAHTISNRVARANDEERSKLHVAAVVVSNFTNHLYALAEAYCRKEKIDFDLLKPLIGETAMRLEQASPQDVQTGPAARNDQQTITKHLELLGGHEKLKELYRVMTESILNSEERKN